MKSCSQVLPDTSSSGLSLRPRRKKNRDVLNAPMLRPADVYQLYGIPSSTLCHLCKHPDPAKRLPSLLIPGRCGRKGLRLIRHSELKAWLARWETGFVSVVDSTSPKAA